MAHRKKDQKCYKVCIVEIDDGTEFFISKYNFKVEEAPPTPFASETTWPNAPPPIPTTLGMAIAHPSKMLSPTSKGGCALRQRRTSQTSDIRGLRLTTTMSPRRRTCRRWVKPLLFQVVVDGRNQPFAAAVQTTSRTSPGVLRITDGMRLRTTMSCNSFACAFPKNGSSTSVSRRPTWGLPRT